ncbi:MAG: hypothetical protein JO197_03745 [Acidobacteria bacterium]|nr:hypothetical protein [Acidobacteriota bacterium]MBV9476501.1 hypothetical protein [Acidobacteriota bacterium]
MRRALAAVFVILAALPLHAQDDDASRADPKIVAYALSSTERAWNFITAPESGYAERLAVARKAALALPLSYLPRYFAARDATNGRWYVQMPPESAFATVYIPQPHGTIEVLGHLFQVPEKLIPFPRTFEERARTPWPWQVSRALAEYWQELVRHRPADELFAYARTMPCRSDEEQRRFLDITYLSLVFPAVAPDDIEGAWRNIVRRQEGGAAILVNGAIPAQGREMLVALVALELARQDKVSTAAFHLKTLVSDVDDADVRDFLAYEIGRRIVANRAISLDERADAGFMVAWTYDDKLIPLEKRYSKELYPALIAAFTQWFAAHEETLAARARLAAPAIAAAEARYTSELCK